jgi:hypothetical protein
MSHPNAAPPNAAPSIRALIFVPCLVALAVTLARLGLEFASAPAWLANKNLGGAGAILGIAWLPLVFGPIFALKIRPHAPTRKAAWLRTWRALSLYGFFSRVPVFLLTIGAVYGDWDTHLEKFPFEGGPLMKIGTAALAQLGGWAFVWTPALGLLAAVVAVGFRPRPKYAAA